MSPVVQGSKYKANYFVSIKTLLLVPAHVNFTTLRLEQYSMLEVIDELQELSLLSLPEQSNL